MAAFQLREGQQRPFFVYGTLLPGQPNEALWRQDVVAREEAVLPHGRLYDMGHYPMLVPHDGEQVQGMVMHVAPEAYTAVLQRLDHLEGHDPDTPDLPGYRRVVWTVRTAAGDRLEAWVYRGERTLVDGQSVIASGDWATYSQNRKRETAAWWADIDSVAGRHLPPAMWG